MNNRFEKNQLWQLIKAHFKELIREPGVLFWGIVFPILMSLGLGVAFTQMWCVKLRLSKTKTE